ncbi:hypothetical protein C8R43DRAFT_19840 [Mycena crocata]|nr:hypothetical protein C8R43DRAFT_19840 [Mycena crocata]
MAITTLESQRRNSVVLLDALPRKPPPPPRVQPQNACVVPLKDSSRRIIACESRLRWEGSLTRRRRRLDAAQRAFLNTHGRSTPPLFTHLSMFPTYTLPPLGARAYNLDDRDPKRFVIGEKVRVRRFKMGAGGGSPSWTEWQHGQVVQNLPMRAFIGNFGRAYNVRVFQSGKETVQTYVQFIGEIAAEEAPDDELTLDECANRRRKANWIYARIPSETEIEGIPVKDVWTPAEILTTWEAGKDIFVRALVGPTAGREGFVRDAIPYTLETAVACRKQNQGVTGRTGTLILGDMDVKPLNSTLPETLPVPMLNLPSPSVFVANPVLQYSASKQ